MGSGGGRAFILVAAAASGPISGLTLVEVEHPLWRALAVAFLLTAPAVSIAALLPSLPPLGKYVCGLAAAVALNGSLALALLSLGVWSHVWTATMVGVVSAVLLLLSRRPALGAPSHGGGHRDDHAHERPEVEAAS